MSDPRLPDISELFGARQDQALQELLRARQIIRHPTEKGDRTEDIWCDILRSYLPGRYDVRKAFVVDCTGHYSQQIDLVVHDRFYTPLVFTFGAYEIVPIEAVYAVFEVKQDVRKKHLEAAMEKAASVRRLTPRLAATAQVPRPVPNRILGGLLATETDSPSLLTDSGVAEYINPQPGQLNFICSAKDALVESWDDNGEVSISTHFPAATMPMKLARAMQSLGTVSPIDLDAYVNP